MTQYQCLFSSDGLSEFVAAMLTTVALGIALAAIVVWKITR